MTGSSCRCTAVRLPPGSLEDADRQAMFSWFTRAPAYRADFVRTAELAPGALDLRAWAQQQRDRSA